MCLAIPARIVEVDGAVALVELDGIRRKINVAMVPDAVAGDYVLVHAGFAIEKWTAAQAEETYALLREMQGNPDGVTPAPETRRGA